MLTHIACLCDVCHAATHLGRTRKFSGSDQAAKEALQHLAKVDGLTLPQAAEYVRQELLLTAERSKLKWTLDLSLLEREFSIPVPPKYLPDGGHRGLLRRLVGAAR